MNKCTGVVGVFNCQGAGWCKVTKKTRIHNADPGTLTGTISAQDVDSIAQLAGPDWDGQAIVYSYTQWIGYPNLKQQVGQSSRHPGH